MPSLAMDYFSTDTRTSTWPHRLVVALALVTFPLIWVGSLVTTYDAGMAVPDWPGTFGYNLLLYPWRTWIAGPFDLFIEHGHRLLGASAGLLAIGLVVAVLATDRRRWLIKATLGALILVVIQGALGGARVLFDERLVALVHGCVGPLFFAYLAALVVATSGWWTTAPQTDSAAVTRLARLAWLTGGLAYLQLVLGAVMRHVPLGSSPGVFRAALVLHLLVAGVLTGYIGVVWWRGRALAAARRATRVPRCTLVVLILAQLALGGATYVAKYAFPAWAMDYQFAASYVVHEKSLFQSLVTTAHVANGSLILFVAVLLAMRVSRLAAIGQTSPRARSRSSGDPGETAYIARRAVA